MLSWCDVVVAQNDGNSATAMQADLSLRAKAEKEGARQRARAQLYGIYGISYYRSETLPYEYILSASRHISYVSLNIP